MIISVDSVGDLEVEPGTPLRTVLESAQAPSARWCGPTRLDLDHRAGRAPLRHAALLTTSPHPAPPPAGLPRIVALAGPDAGLGLAPTAPAVIGRGRGAALSVDDAALSRAHAEIDPRGRLRDLGSTNGTLRVRGGRARRVGRRRLRLRDGDHVRLGRTLLAWHDPGRASPTEARQAAAPRTTALGLAGGAAGGVALGAATGRWWVGAMLAAAPAAVAAAGWWARRRHVGTAPHLDGLERLSDLPFPLAVIGDPPDARAAARAAAVAQDRAWRDVPQEAWERWLARRAPSGSVTLVTAGDQVPSDAAAVLDVRRGTVAVDGRTEPWTPALMSAATAERLARHARRSDDPPAREVWWGELARPAGGVRGAPRRLAATIGRDDAGRPLEVDLDADGPHLLVAGTTGAGKSLLLETLVAALAEANGPGDLGIALIDLKGGAGLASCTRLPHVCGSLTDLEPHDARRALLGIADELRVRKRSLRARGLASWHAWERDGGAPPRMLVVVDEFQELGAADPGFLAQAATLAAQGRSLGIHLVLATQRPAGAVTPQIRANVGTVIALRVASAAESHDLLGDETAARLPAARPGAAVLAGPSRRVSFQVARPVTDARPPARLVDRPAQPSRPLASAAAARWAGHPPPPPLWLPGPDAAPEPPPGSAGWIDRPEIRRREPLVWNPDEGVAIVLGPRGAGRASAVDALAAATPGAIDLPGDPREAVRTLELACRGGAVAVVVGDAQAARAALEAALRSPGDLALEEYARRVPMILGCAPGWPARWGTRAALRIVLAGVDPAERSLWGVPRDLIATGATVAVGPAGAAVARMHAAPDRPHGEPLVRPLRCGPRLAAGAVGVRGDAAAPFGLRGDVEVAGPDPASRDRLRAHLRRLGVDAVDVATPSRRAGVVTLVAGASPTLLRAWGLGVPPGLLDPEPPPGRVLLITPDGCEAAQLRGTDAEDASAARRDDVAGGHDDEHADGGADHGRGDAHLRP